jgi:hypothetical protein
MKVSVAIHRFNSSFAFLLCLAMLLLPRSNAASTLDVYNPGFETTVGALVSTSTTTKPPGWQTAGPSNSVFTWVAATPGVDPGQNVHSGTAAVSVGGLNPGDIARWVQAGTEPIAAGEAAQVTAWIKMTGVPEPAQLPNNGYRYVIQFLDGSGTLLGTVASTSGAGVLQGTGTWNQYSFTTPPAPTGTVSMRLSLFLVRLPQSIQGDSPVMTFDDVAVFALNLAYPEPIASWGSDAVSSQEQATNQYLLPLLSRLKDGSSTNPSTYTIQPGDYRFDNMTTNQNVVISGHHDITINASGVTFWFNPFYATASGSKNIGIEFDNCYNITINGLKVDYTVTPYSQGRVTNIDSSGNVTFALDAGFSAPDTSPPNTQGTIVDNGKMIFVTTNQYGAMMRTLPGAVSPGATNNQDGTYTVSTTTGLYMFQSQSLQPFIGSYVVLAGRNWPNAIYLNNSTGMQFSGVAVYGSPQMAITEGSGSDGSPAGANTYNGCKVVPRPNTSRILSSNADAFHSFFMARGPVVENCEFGWSGDDNMNIHGGVSVVYQTTGTAYPRFDLVTQLVDDLVVGGSGFSASAGTVRFYDPGTLKPLPGSNGDSNVLNSASPTPTPTASPAPTPVSDPIQYTSGSFFTSANAYVGSSTTTGTFLYKFMYQFLGIFDNPVSEFTVDQAPTSATQGTVAMKRGKIANGTMISHNWFHDTIGHGIILKSENGTIDSNYIERAGFCSIMVAPDVTFMEGPYSRNITITNNTIDQSGSSNLFSNDADNVQIGAITVTADAQKPTLSSPQTAEHSNITISSNAINNPAACGIWATDITTGTVSSNAITTPFFYGLGNVDPAGPVGNYYYSSYYATNPANSYNPKGPYAAICTANSSGLNVTNNAFTSGTCVLYYHYGWPTP